MTSTTTQPGAAIPPDDTNRKLTVADPDDPKLRHVSGAGGTYTILVSGEQTGGRYCLIDMLVPAGGGPPPHRHDFEEMFTILDGEIELTFRGEVQRASTGSTVNVPANAPHSFKNMTDKPARLLCMCTPAGQEEFFMAVGDPSTAAPRRRRSSARKSGPNASNAPKRFRPSIEPSCWCEGPGSWVDRAPVIRQALRERPSQDAPEFHLRRCRANTRSDCFNNAGRTFATECSRRDR
jgi:quercetin dioxygenase-like cupin family protein